MGHYDDYYEFDARERAKEDQKGIRDLFKEYSKKLSVDDMDFLNTVIGDIKQWKSLMYLLKAYK